MTERKPIVPVSEEQRQKLLALQGVVILGNEKGGNHFKGYVEHSWSMDWSSDHVLFWWSGPATSNLGSKHMLDARKDAEHALKSILSSHTSWDVTVWDVRDEALPVILDWESWVQAQAFNPNTLSGVTDKFKARNMPFKMKG